MRRFALATVLVVLFVFSGIAGATEYEDLPRGHWAYDSVKRLHEAGVIDVFPDGEFKGEVLLTRYDLAVTTDKAIQYLVRNVEHMNREQAKSIADLVSQLLGEFRNELLVMALDVRQLEMQLAEIHRTPLWTFELDTEVYTKISSVIGPAVKDPFDTTSASIEAERSHGIELNGILRGQRGDYTFVAGLTGLVVKNHTESQATFSFEDLYAQTWNEGLTVRVGTLQPGVRTAYLFSDAEDSLMGVSLFKIYGPNGTNVLDVSYGFAREDQEIDAVATIRTFHTIGSAMTMELLASHVFGRDSSDDHGVGGIRVGFDVQPLFIKADLAFDFDGDTYKSLNIGSSIGEKTYATLAFEDVDSGFEPVFSELTSGRTLSGMVGVSVTDDLGIYVTAKEYLNEPSEPTEFSIGFRHGALGIGAGHATLSGYYNNKKGVGLDATFPFHVDGGLQLGVVFPVETDQTRTLQFAAWKRLGDIELRGSYENKMRDENSLDTLSIGLNYLLTEDAVLGLTWDNSKYYNVDPHKSFDTNTTRLSVGFRF